MRIITQPWYHKRLSRENAEERLGMTDTNCFLVRESAQEFGKLVLSIRNGDNFYHFPVEHGVGSYQIEGTDEPFSSVMDLIYHYQQYGLPESDTGEVVLLESPCVHGDSLPSTVKSMYHNTIHCLYSNRRCTPNSSCTHAQSLY